MTAAQRAMSTVYVDRDANGATPASEPAFAPGAQVGGPQSQQLSGEYVVAKSKAPMIVVLLFVLVALAGAGYFGWKQFGAPQAAEPLVVAPPPEKNDEPDPVAAKEPKKEPEKEPEKE